MAASRRAGLAETTIRHAGVETFAAAWRWAGDSQRGGGYRRRPIQLGRGEELATREEAKKEINKLFQQNPALTTSDLDTSLWKDKENWEEYLDSLYLSSQINLFVREMKKVIKEKAEIEQEKPKKARKNAKQEIEDFAKNNWTKDELKSEELQKKIREFNKKIDKTSADELSSVINEANEFIIDIKVKRQGLHWKGKIHNWADRWLLRNRNSFESAWEKMTKLYGGVEPDYFDIAAIYKINFPPSLWNELTEKQKELAKDIAMRWMKLNIDVYDRTGKLMEKYNVVDTHLEAGGGEYPGQDGFGWTNGVLLALIVKYGKPEWW